MEKEDKLNVSVSIGYSNDNELIVYGSDTVLMEFRDAVNSLINRMLIDRKITMTQIELTNSSKPKNITFVKTVIGGKNEHKK